MSQDQLNAMLQQWADRHTASRRDTAELEKRIREELAHETVRLPTRQVGRVATGRWHRMVWFLAGAAALLMVQCVITRLHPPQGASDAALALVRRETATDSTTATLFNEAAELFPNRLRWIAETDERVHVEVLTSAVNSDSEASTFLDVRFVGLYRAADSGWQRGWTVTVITDGSDLITVEVPGRGTMHIWARQVDDRVIATDTGFDLPQGEVSISRALVPGVPERCLSFETTAGKFRVYQLVRPLTIPHRDGRT